MYASGSSKISRTLVWVDRNGQQETINAEPRAYTYVRLSPDGTRVALDVRDQQFDIWIWDLKRENLQRLTSDPGLDISPVWTPSGERVAFNSARDGKASGIFWQAADGSGEAERIDTGSREQIPHFFSPDGKRLVFSTPATAPYNLGVLELGNPRRERILPESTFNKNNGVVSPDGRWLAYQSSESGTDEIYVSPFPEIATSRQLVSSGGGTRPLWSKDGRELFYYVDSGTIMAAPVTLGSTFSFDKPVVAVKGSFARPVNAGLHYDVSPDGKRFLLLKDVETSSTGQPAANELRIVLQFFHELDRLAGKGN